jgi:hypothetical protein
LPAEVEVLGGECSDGTVTQLIVDVHLKADRPVDGVIRAWSQRDRVRVAWDQQRLRPGHSRMRVQAPNSVASLQADSQAQLMVNVGQQRAYDHFETSSVCTSL